MALELCERTIDDLTDLEVLSRMTDDGWFVTMCLDQLHRLPSEVDPILGCREYCLLQAHAIVKQAQAQMMRRFQNQNTGMS